MSQVSVSAHVTTTPPAPRRPIPWYAFGAANLVIVTALSLLFWYLLIDPAWSGLGLYPQPFLALLFWTVLAVVWIGFNLEFVGFDRLRQPARGLAVIAVSLAIGAGITYLLAYGWGRIDPSFAADRADGAGYLTGALFVLFGFFFFVTGVVNWQHWPFARAASPQPWTGLGQIGLLMVPTLLVYAILGLPGLAVWADPATAWFSTDTLIGWFYSVIVSVVLTGLITDNWPWRLAGSPGRVAAVSIAGNLALGTALYYLFLSVGKVVIGSDAAAAIGPGITAFAAQIGVCWVFWMIFWANACGNRPDGLSPAVNYAVRIGVTLALGVGTFLAYYFLFAGTVLHEPAVAGALHGNALGWMNWMVLWTLYYVVCLESYGLPRPVPSPRDPSAQVN
ncbi:hypothetical protein [Hoyosella subflava]|uniref:Hypothetical membrane protein n=1 Tax=Hoyosella subflava (strain DSM 45089 / JCM 17490 / NBRC 109087 / DQS3-9A1) TaxID=443218 RepID=F6EM34_HOYSD|nr:hypothetical protein [Hoyosella subflava]AEF42815.1 Hypothetical membrane protein [Hoyosella subflava DQS3-9A1]